MPPITPLRRFLSGKMVFKNIRVFFLGSDDFPKEAKSQATRDLNAALEGEWQGFDIGERIALADIARAVAVFGVGQSQDVHFDARGKERDDRMHMLRNPGRGVEGDRRPDGVD